MMRRTTGSGGSLIANTDTFQMQQPLISIITAVRNAVRDLPATIESLRAQECRDFEYVVVDGASTDGTRDLLDATGDPVTRWVSEPDGGISDAFNKGVRMAHGTLILFLGAGDRLADPGAVGRIREFASTVRAPRFFYGDVLYDYGTTQRRIHRNYRWDRFRRYSCIPHQAMFLERWFFDEYGLFDISYRITMDYEHTARFIRTHPPEYIDSVIAVMPRTGASTNPWATHREMNRVRRSHGLDSRFLVALSWLPVLAKAAYCRLFRQPW